MNIILYYIKANVKKYFLIHHLFNPFYLLDMDIRISKSNLFSPFIGHTNLKKKISIDVSQYNIFLHKFYIDLSFNNDNKCTTVARYVE